MNLVDYLYRRYPGLKKEILMAHLKISTHDFIKKTLFNAFIYAIFFAILVFFMLQKMASNNDLPVSSLIIFLLCVFCAFPILFALLFSLLLGTPLAAIRRRKNDIEKEVLFAGRYLLIKLNSGKPLLNSLIDASKSYGVASKYFKEIVDDITLGMPLEEAIQQAMNLSPSESFKKILFQIYNSLLIGVDVSETLQAVLDDITAEQFSEIEEYSHKLNSIAMFYMLAAIVIPSLGLTVTVVVAGIAGLQITNSVYVLLWFFLVIIQLIFVHIFRAIRPNINF